MPAAKAHSRATYHHGDLRRTLIDAAESLIAERGADGFALREVARRAGVSAAAPAHHFGDAAGLLAAVATEGFLALTASLRDGERRGGTDPRRRLVSQGVGYVRFALARPGQFRVMFRSGVLQPDPTLREAAGEAFSVLEEGVRAVVGVASGAPLDAAGRVAVVTLWSLVHGFAHLAIAGRFARLAGEAGPEAWIRRTLPAALDVAVAGIVGSMPGSAHRSR